MRSKYQQSGMTTLLITSLLLIVALLFSLASYKNLFYQIKRTQNEVLARQAHWVAEGGLECSYSILNVVNSLSDPQSTINSNCSYNIPSNESLSIEVELNSSNYKIISTSTINDVAIASINKVAKINNMKTGVFQATSDLILNYSGGNVNVYPEPGDKNFDGYNCIVARFSNYLEVKGTLNNVGLDPNYLPYDDFPVSIGPNTPNPPVPNSYLQKCNDGSNSLTGDFWTESVTDSDYLSNPSAFDNDFLQISTLDPFENVFGYPREEWASAKSELGFVEVNGGLNCSSNIATAINSGRSLIWINDNCDLSLNTGLITSATDNHGGAIIVVQDGVVGFFGAAMNLDIMLYQFLTPNVTPAWSPSDTDWNAGNATVAASVPDKSSYIHYQAGSLTTAGGFIFDMPTFKAEIIGSANIAFDGNIVRDLLGKPVWVQGSWNDL
ncbi:hypothetical protein CTM94_19740 [Photobacterium leiognathi]|uniref:Type 4 fimbrial biogenesis protein PilX N-terminal domain-containing protein n=2 Tax=Photobacterium leiognathi TaxID=553611 RepID=A0ABX5GAX5_PHOLE|nr:hypothetical protein UB42_18600 [Photobacterium leiognathi]PSV77745.1 hypothetical protein CTM94_19740 [Photobacterium leiognathi]